MASIDPDAQDFWNPLVESMVSARANAWTNSSTLRTKP